MIIVVAVAQLVAGAVASTLDGMHQVMLAEERKSAEHVDLSIVCMRLSSSASDSGWIEEAKALTTTIRLLVALRHALRASL